jgi:hypothetical protein
MKGFVPAAQLIENAFLNLIAMPEKRLLDNIPKR